MRKKDEASAYRKEKTEKVYDREEDSDRSREMKVRVWNL